MGGVLGWPKGVGALELGVQAGADALSAHQKGHGLQGVDRRVAHQVHAVGVGARAQRHASGVDDGHEHQSHRLELFVQRAVPLQAHHQALQVGDHHARANALQAMDAAEIAHGGHFRRGVAQRHHVHRIAATAGQAGLAQHARLEPICAQFDDALQRLQLR